MGQAQQPIIVEQARTFIYTHARLLDRLRFAFSWEKGSKKAVLLALKGYQNEDGGFGHALEPDIRTPSSQPIAVEMALLQMEELSRFDATMVAGIGKYLKHIALPDGGFPRTQQSVNEAPHAPRWQLKSEPAFSMNPTGRILGLLLKQKSWLGYEREPWFRLSVRQVWEAMEQGEPADYHEAVQWIHFLQHFPDRALSRSYQSKLDEWLASTPLIERDPEVTGPIHKVLDWAPLKDSYARRFMKPEEIQLHLACLLEEQQEDGGWPISWPALSTAAENEWRGHVTVNRLLTLRSYNRI